MSDYGEYNDEYDGFVSDREEEEDMQIQSEGEGEDDYEYAEEGEDIIMAEINAYERAGGGITSYTLKSVKNPKEKYKFILVSLFEKMGLNITTHDKNEILQSVASRDDIIYKNPYGYILGYIGSRGGRGITRESIKQAFDSIGSTEGIEEPDVVRYSVFWVNNTKK
jgi:hypothetical protein